MVAKFSLQHIPSFPCSTFLPSLGALNTSFLYTRFVCYLENALSPASRYAHFLAIFLLISALISSPFLGLAIFAPEKFPPIFNTIRNNMRYDIQPLPGATAGTPRKPPSAPAKVVAGHLVSKLGRPSRSRRSLLLSLVLLIAVQCLVLGRRHAVSLPRPYYVQLLTDGGTGRVATSRSYTRHECFNTPHRRVREYQMARCCGGHGP